jgi:hypothetical protein
MKSDYIRDKSTGALILVNNEKAKTILKQRSMDDEIRILKNEINILKEQVKQLLAERN